MWTSPMRPRSTLLLAWLASGPLVLSFLGACSPLGTGRNQLETDGGGEESKVELPPTVGLRFDTGRKCSGSFIREDLILTSALCVSGARGVTILGQGGPFRDLPASQRFISHPEMKLPGNEKARTTTPGLDIAFVLVTSMSAPEGYISSLATAKPKRKQTVWLQGYQHNLDSKARQSEFEKVSDLGSNTIYAIDAAPDLLIKLNSEGTPADENERAGLPGPSDWGSALHNEAGELIGIMQSFSGDVATYVNLNSPRVQSFIEETRRSIEKGEKSSNSNDSSGSPATGQGPAYVPKCSVDGLQKEGYFRLSFVPGDSRVGTMRLVSGQGFSCKKSVEGSVDQFFPSCAKACPQDMSDKPGDWGWCEGISGFTCVM